MDTEVPVAGKDAEKDEKEKLARFAGVLNGAATIFLEFEEYKYSGDIEEMKLGEYIVFTVHKPDDGLVRLPTGYEDLLLKAVAPDNKTIRCFKTGLIKRKLPRLLLKFPEKELPSVARKHQRLFMNLNTPLVVKKGEKSATVTDRTGMGFITNVSEGGVSISTKMRLEKGEKVIFFLNVSGGKGEKSQELSGIVRRADELENGVVNYGLQYVALDAAGQKAVKWFLEKHPSRASGK